ncbi:MAG: T9SS type A sorting domain-containing protein [Flavobacteriales bacterium]|nr:T9SS type A sorting domain-containing protein [Flavobacteriales bacterium]
MIRIFSSVFFIIHCQALYSQWIASSKSISFSINELPVYFSTEKSGGSLIINYDLSDETDAGSLSYKRAIWPINKNFDTISTDSLFTYIVCGFDSLIDPTNTYSFTYSSIPVFQIDSIWIALGHENNSGLNDTLIIQLISLSASGYPSLQVMWADTLIFSSGQSYLNQWTNSLILRIAPSLNWNTTVKPAIKLQYKAPIEDTLGVVAGYRISGVCGANDAAQWSAFYPNSYAYWTGFNALIPTAVGGDIYYDCNANLQFDSLTDGRNYIQNWHIGIQITAPEIGVENQQTTFTPKIFPNPTSDWLTLQSEQPILEVKIINSQGELIMCLNNTHEVISLQQLNNGMYFIHIKTSTRSYVKKLLVHHHLD